MSSGPELRERIDEFVRDAQKLVENGQSALKYLSQGDMQSACDVIAISHYPMSHVRNDYDALVEEFEKLGVRPGEGH